MGAPRQHKPTWCARTHLSALTRGSTAALEAPAIPAERPVIPGTEKEEEYVPRAELLNRQITLARGLVAENPGGAVQALRQMLNHMPTEDEAKAA